MQVSGVKHNRDRTIATPCNRSAEFIYVTPSSLLRDWITAPDVSDEGMFKARELAAMMVQGLPDQQAIPLHEALNEALSQVKRPLSAQQTWWQSIRPSNGQGSN